MRGTVPYGKPHIRAKSGGRGKSSPSKNSRSGS